MPEPRTNWFSRWLEPVAGIYRSTVSARRRAYEVGEKPQKFLPRPVISVGNLTVGGSGKTPVVLYICQRLSGWRQVAVLTRGYGRKNRTGMLTLPKASSLDERAPLFFGDEPVMMANHLDNVSIHVGANRFATGRRALDRSPVDLFVLDDGFQHLELHRDLDIVVINGMQNPPDLNVIPAGPLRESPEVIHRAHIVLINHCKPDGTHHVDMNWLSSMCPNAVIARSRYKFSKIVDCKSHQEISIDELRNHPLFAFCGIGSPEAFEETLLGMKLNLVGSNCFPDHHYYRGKELHSLEQRAIEAGADGLVTTEKDIVRIQTSRIRGLPIYHVEIELEVLAGEEEMWERIGEVVNGH